MGMSVGNIEVVPEAEWKEWARLLTIAHETDNGDIRDFALRILSRAMEPPFDLVREAAIRLK